MANYVHENDLPENVTFDGDIAIDTEAMGLNHFRDRLCVLQISDGKGDAHLIRFKDRDSFEAPNLKALLQDPSRTKIFHYARFDVSIILFYLGILVQPVYCTKIASRIARTYTDQHGLKELCRELVGKQISKQQQSSDWGNHTLTKEQIDYAAADVLHLHEIRKKLNIMLERENRMRLAEQCFAFLPSRVLLDHAGWENIDIFSY